MATKQCINLEITPKNIKLLEVSQKKKKQLSVETAVVEPYPSKDKMSDALKAAMSQVKKESKFVTMSIWASTMITRKVTLPLMRPAELEGAIQIEADKYVPFSLDQSIIDYYTINEDIETNKIDAMIIASKKDLISRRCEFLTEMGFSISFIDVHPVALSNLYTSLLSKDEAGKTFAMIHIGDNPGLISGEDSFMSVVSNGKPATIRDLGDKLSSEEIAPDAYVQIAGQITSTIDFYENGSKQKVEYLVVTGYDPVCQKLEEAIKQKIQKEIRYWNVTEAVGCDASAKEAFDKYQPGFLVLLGLAHRKFQK